MAKTAAFLPLIAALLGPAYGFVQPTSQGAIRRQPTTRWNDHPAELLKHQHDNLRLPPASHRSSIACFMYNLPPGKNDKNGLGEIAVGVLSIMGLIAFFISPLGALFFALFNSLLAFSLLLPLGLLVAFQAWQFFNTTQGACPNCSASLRVLKDGSPSICLNCGSIVQADPKGGIEFAPSTSSNVFVERDSVFGGLLDDSWGSTRKPVDKRNKDRRERTIIDVDVEEDD